MMKSVYTLLIPVGSMLLLSACNEVSQAELDEVRMRAEEARTMAAEARDIALRAEQKADQALAAANSP